jgi:hypothetical protein
MRGAASFARQLPHPCRVRASVSIARAATRGSCRQQPSTPPLLEGTHPGNCVLVPGKSTLKASVSKFRSPHRPRACSRADARLMDASAPSLQSQRVSAFGKISAFRDATAPPIERTWV